MLYQEFLKEEILDITKILLKRKKIDSSFIKTIQFNIEVSQKKIGSKIHGVPVICPNDLPSPEGIPLIIAVGACLLMIAGEFDSYKALLFNSYNPVNLENIMCRSLISIDWQGNLYDCDFNQQLGINIGARPKNLIDLLNYKKSLHGDVINVGDHCYGCTAGNGSSCSGSLN